MRSSPRRPHSRGDCGTPSCRPWLQCASPVQHAVGVERRSELALHTRACAPARRRPVERVLERVGHDAKKVDVCAHHRVGADVLLDKGPLHQRPANAAEQLHLRR
eukprot:1667185-Prymnesium_polylepis.1